MLDLYYCCKASEVSLYLFCANINMYKVLCISMNWASIMQLTALQPWVSDQEAVISEDAAQACILSYEEGTAQWQAQCCCSVSHRCMSWSALARHLRLKCLLAFSAFQVWHWCFLLLSRAQLLFVLAEGFGFRTVVTPKCRVGEKPCKHTALSSLTP